MRSKLIQLLMAVMLIVGFGASVASAHHDEGHDNGNTSNEESQGNEGNPCPPTSHNPGGTPPNCGHGPGEPPEECLDDDDDGVCNDDDECPEEVGTVENNGCPAPCLDDDEDGVCNDDDDCPEEAGTVENNGCPAPCLDDDSDGVCNDDDDCPEEAGTVENNGCPASCPDDDSDGVCNDDDACPQIPAGTTDEDGDGCPDETSGDPCTGEAGDAGLLTDDTLGQTFYDEGASALEPLVEDPEADDPDSEPLSAGIKGAGEGEDYEVITDELGCGVDFLIHPDTGIDI